MIYLLILSIVIATGIVIFYNLNLLPLSIASAATSAALIILMVVLYKNNVIF